MYQLSVTEMAEKALRFSKEFVANIGGSEVGTEHILLGIANVSECPASKILKEQYNATADEIESLLGEVPEVFGGSFSTNIDFSARSKSVLLRARDLSAARGNGAVNTEHLLLSIIQNRDSIACRILKEAFKVDLSALEQDLMQSLTVGWSGAKSAGTSVSRAQLPNNLKEMGIDLTLRASEKKLDPVIGREKEIERIIQILCRKTKNNPVLIGEPGVGKSAVVEGLAQEIVKGNVPELLKDKIVYTLDIGSLLAGTKYRGALEEKLKEVIETIVKAKNIIVFIDELHTLATAGSEKGEVKPSDMLKPYLARGELQTIGATTTEEYRKFVEKDKALERRFQPIMVEPPTVEHTIQILKGLRDNYEAFHKIQITDEAIAAAATLSDRYIMDRFLPDKAIDLIDEAASKAKVSGNTLPREVKQKEEQLKKLEVELADAIRVADYLKADGLKKQVEELKEQVGSSKASWQDESAKAKTKIDVEDIAAIVSSWTKIPLNKINESEKDKLLKLEEILHKRVIGQDEAIVAVSKAIRRARAGLKSPNKPIGSFIFLGPTGVGKTELCKAIAEAMFDDENLIIRLDMSEYMESHSTSKLIGSPPGYVGYDEGGQLTEQVRHKPYSVVLFDEIEKAHPDVYNMLLQILDEGRLTDSQGRVINFKNTVIIMTSNVGVSGLKDAPRALGFSDEKEEVRDKKKTEEMLNSALKKRFKPEFLNRVDVITIFHNLEKDQIAEIALKMLEGVNKKLKDKNIKVKFENEVIDYLVDKGYDHDYGARPLRRVVEQHIEDAIAEKLLAGEIEDNDNISCTARDGVLAFDKI